MHNASEYLPYRVSEVGLVVTMFGAATSISLVSIGYGLLLLGFVLERSYALKIRSFFDSPLAVTPGTLMSWSSLEALYSGTSTETINLRLSAFLRPTVAFLAFARTSSVGLVMAAWCLFFGGESLH